MNNDFSDLGGTPADMSDLGGTPAQGSQPSGPTDNPVLGGIGQVVRGGSDLLRGVGLGVVPNLAANIYDTVNTLSSGKPVSTQQNYGDPFRNRQEEQQAESGNPVVSGAKDAAGAASWMMPELNVFKGGRIASAAGNKILTGAGKGMLAGVAQQNATPQSVGAYTAGGAVLDPLLGMLKAGMLTKGGAANKATQAAAKATTSGASLSWGDLSSKISQEVKKELGDTVEVNNHVRDFLAARTPAGQLPDVSTPAPQTATNLIDMRRQLSKLYGQSFLQKAINGENPQTKVANIARRVISENLHNIAPGTITPDKLYSLYSKGGILGGDLPHLLLKYVAAPIAAKTLGGPISGMIKQQAGQ